MTQEAKNVVSGGRERLWFFSDFSDDTGPASRIRVFLLWVGNKRDKNAKFAVFVPSFYDGVLYYFIIFIKSWP